MAETFNIQFIFRFGVILHQSLSKSLMNYVEKWLVLNNEPSIRHAKRLNFDTSGFLEDPKLTRKQRDSRQKFHGDKPKNQSGFILLEHKYINLYLVTPFGTKMQS